MGLSPLRVALSLAIGGAATGGLYLTQQAVGRPLPPASPVVVSSPRPVAPPHARAALPMPSAPRRIVFRHTAPGDVVLTTHGDELLVEFIASPPKAPASVPKTPPKKSVPPASPLPHPATPVATR